MVYFLHFRIFLPTNSFSSHLTVHMMNNGSCTTCGVVADIAADDVVENLADDDTGQQMLQMQYFEQFQYAIYGWAVPIISLVGLFGNGVAVLVLNHREVRNKNCCLRKVYALLLAWHLA